MIDKIAVLRWIRSRVEQIFEIVGSILRLTETGGTLTTDGAEQNLYINETPMGVYKPIKVQIDFTNQTGLETTVARVYYRISNAVGAAYVLKDMRTFIGSMDLALLKFNLVNIELEPNRFGVKVTFERTAGGAKAYPWTVFFEG